MPDLEEEEESQPNKKVNKNENMYSIVNAKFHTVCTSGFSSLILLVGCQEGQRHLA